MLEVLRSASDYLDSLIGIRGVLGHIAIILIIMAGHAWANYVPSVENSPNAHDATKKRNESDEKDPPRNFTLKQLNYFNGTKEQSKTSEDIQRPVYIALNGIVFDVSEGRNFYGPGGPYELFAGHECGVALAKMSFDTEYLDNLDMIPQLKHGERVELENWIEKFTHYRQYPVLGRLLLENQLPPTDRILTLQDLECHSGLPSEPTPLNYATPPIYIGAGDKVFDVSFGGVTFYGPGCSYHRFAGKDASRALAKMSFEPQDLESNSIEDLTDKERNVLYDWIKTFEERKGYPIVGRLDKS